MTSGNPALVFALAMAIGMLAQVVARHLQLPGIVLLLAAGVVFGPDVLDLVRPDDLGGAVQIIVGFAVAIILFEGGMNLDLRRLRAEALVIRRLVTIGAAITAVGGTLTARLLMGWDWELSVLFGTLVIVTGPTVVTPLVRRLRVTPPVSTILEAEGVLIDPIGAIIAVVTLELLFSGENPAGTLVRPLLVLGGGGLIGFAGGWVIALMLKPARLVPEGLENVLVLALVVTVFQFSESVIAESGLAAAVAAGLTVGNIHTRAGTALFEFKEQLTTLMIALLFVLLAADVRIQELQAIGWRALATVAVLMLLIRPIQALVCTAGSNLTFRQRAFIASLAPRGIVAAAVASLFAETIAARGAEGGVELRALVFMVIAVTVTIHGLTGGFIARLLGVRRPSDRGWVILGANGLSIALAQLLRDEQPEIIMIDSNPDRVLTAQRAGFSALYGQGLLNEVLENVELESKLGCLALTPNEEVNVLWAAKVRSLARIKHVCVTLRDGPRAIPPENAHDVGATVLFGRGQPVEQWADRIDRGEVLAERWRYSGTAALAADAMVRNVPPHVRDALLVLTVRRPGRVRPFDDDTVIRERDESDIVILDEQRADVELWLGERGWARSEQRKSAVR